MVKALEFDCSLNLITLFFLVELHGCYAQECVRSLLHHLSSIAGSSRTGESIYDQSPKTFRKEVFPLVGLSEDTASSQQRK